MNQYCMHSNGKDSIPFEIEQVKNVLTNMYFKDNEWMNEWIAFY